jgi:GNAT superfamily N-acetyltransferase
VTAAVNVVAGVQVVQLLPHGVPLSREGFDLQFLCTLGRLDASTPTLHALSWDVAVGSLTWDATGRGEIDRVYTLPAWRRRGVAGALRAVATAMSEERDDWSAPTDSSKRTPAGDAWAARYGAAPAAHPQPDYDESDYGLPVRLDLVRGTTVLRWDDAPER